MNKLKNILLAILTGVASLNPAKAQRAVQVVPEVGFFGNAKSAPSLLTGVNIAVPKGNNFTNLFLGSSLNTNAEAGFMGKLVNNYKWHRNFSSWVRETLVAGKGYINTTLDFAPIRANIGINKKLNISATPAYSRYHNYKTKTVTQGAKGIVQGVYSVTPSDNVTVQLTYATTPSKNITDTHFCKLREGFSFVTTYSKTF